MSKLRAIVDAIDQEILATPPTDALRAQWAALVEVLALGAEPQTRECPTCKTVGMRGASRCVGCWASLEPLPPLSDGTPQKGSV